MGDPRRSWQDVTPDAGLTLRQAMLFYDDEDRAEEFLDLEACGYDGDPPMLVGFDGWPTPDEVLSDYRVNARNLRDARARLEYCLVEKLVTGRLCATGYGPDDPLDAPATPIAADRWRVLAPDYEGSTATFPGGSISGILVFAKVPKVVREGRPSPRFSAAKVRHWYSQRVARHPADAAPPSRDDDLAAVREAFGVEISREVVRELRRELAPEAWRRFGRRKQSR